MSVKAVLHTIYTTRCLNLSAHTIAYTYLHYITLHNVMTTILGYDPWKHPLRDYPIQKIPWRYTPSGRRGPQSVAIFYSEHWKSSTNPYSWP